jgi:hypothetical protein
VAIAIVVSVPDWRGNGVVVDDAVAVVVSVIAILLGSWVHVSPAWVAVIRGLHMSEWYGAGYGRIGGISVTIAVDIAVPGGAIDGVLVGEVVAVIVGVVADLWSGWVGGAALVITVPRVGCRSFREGARPDCNGAVAIAVVVYEELAQDAFIDAGVTVVIDAVADFSQAGGSRCVVVVAVIPDCRMMGWNLTGFGWVSRTVSVPVSVDPVRYGSRDGVVVDHAIAVVIEAIAGFVGEGMNVGIAVIAVTGHRAVAGGLTSGGCSIF